MSVEALQRELERLCGRPEPPPDEARRAVERLLDALEAGTARAARPGPDGWEVCRWVKEGILLGFRVGGNRSAALPPFHFNDRDTFPTRDPTGQTRNVRIVPGGTTVRRGTYLGDGVVIMPPAYVNVGAWVGDRAMVDSHALVGSCAQIGRGVHLSAAAQVGGVLEPAGAMPVIVEDEAFIGGGCGLYEGVRIGRRAVLAPGVVITRGTPVYDLPRERVLRSEGGVPPAIPDGAVVVPGSRPAGGSFAGGRGIQLQTPVIVKYRDETTDAAVALEEALR